MILDIQSLDSISNLTDQINFLLNDASLLKKQSFKQLTGIEAGQMTTKEYFKVLKALFDTSDAESWIRKTDSTPYTKKELEEYKKEMHNLYMRRGRNANKWMDQVKN